MNNASLINQTSSNYEYYTPQEIIEAARNAMGSIDLDPSSSAEANKIVKAKMIFTKEMDSIPMPWDCGTLWMNHPFGRREDPCAPDCQKHLKNPKHVHHSEMWYGNAAWISKLIREMEIGRISYAACCITYACTSEAWFSMLLDYPNCFLIPRTNYLTPDGKVKPGVTKGSVVTYFGRDVQLFKEAFAKLGKLKI